MKHHHPAGLKTRLAMAVRFRPQLDRKSQYTLFIDIFSVPWSGNKYAIFRTVPI